MLIPLSCQNSSYLTTDYAGLLGFMVRHTNRREPTGGNRCSMQSSQDSPPIKGQPADPRGGGVLTELFNPTRFPIQLLSERNYLRGLRALCGLNSHYIRS
jgi:hypothetical protein